MQRYTESFALELELFTRAVLEDKPTPVTGADSRVLLMPVLSPESSGLDRKGTFTLSNDGALAGDVTETFLGDDAAAQRRLVKDTDSKEIHERLERGLGSDLPRSAAPAMSTPAQNARPAPVRMTALACSLAAASRRPAVSSSSISWVSAFSLSGRDNRSTAVAASGHSTWTDVTYPPRDRLRYAASSHL